MSSALEICASMAYSGSFANEIINNSTLKYFEKVHYVYIYKWERGWGYDCIGVGEGQWGQFGTIDSKCISPKIIYWRAWAAQEKLKDIFLISITVNFAEYLQLIQNNENCTLYLWIG